MTLKSFKFTDTDITMVNKVKETFNIPTDIGAIRLCLSKCVEATAVVDKVYTTPRTLLPKIRKYSDTQVDEFCSKTPLSKGWCPKCSTELRPVAAGECACLKSPEGKVELRHWLNAQYE